MNYTVLEYEALKTAKRQTWDKVARALKSGKLQKPDNCQICGEVTADLQLHHYSYKTPLIGVWCCRVCHKTLHTTIRIKYQKLRKKGQ